jgi:2,4-dienoyl-CoA reductase (NADPH2)
LSRLSFDRPPADESFPHLTSPAAIGTMRLKNRMVMSPMTTAYCNDDQTPSERLLRYFEERARGGVGLITMELITVDEVHRYMHRSMTLGADAYIDHHRRITDAIHQHGAKVQPQLSHTGPESVAPIFGGPQTMGPSVCVAPVWGWPSRELAVTELPEIAVQYGEAARRAREAGYDGIELHAAHCYNLLGSFLSPLRNKRTDEYSAFRASSRIRFIVEVLAEIKARAGADFPVTLSLSGYERFPGGRALDDTQRLAPALVAAGVDCFRVSGGVSDALVTMMVGRSEYGDAVNVAQAEAIKNVVDVPVMVVGRIHDPQLGERILAEGRADLIAMARPLLADPQLPNKVAAGRADRIRRCISCENCIDSMQTRDNLGCAVNPRSGREAELTGVDDGRFTVEQVAVNTQTSRPAVLQAVAAAPDLHVVVVGSGAGGLEAARLAALSGHRVTLLERQRRLGGALWLAATVHHDNQPFLDWLLAEVKRLAIDVRLGVAATVQSVAALRPDAVIVATGARVSTPPIAGVEQSSVITGALLRQIMTGRFDRQEGGRLPRWQRRVIEQCSPLLQRLLTPARLRAVSRLWMPLGKTVVIIGADLAALELAEFLAVRGRRVKVLERLSKIAPEVGKKRRSEHMDRLDRLQITVNTAVDIVAIEPGAVLIRVGDKQRKVEGDSIIVAGEPVADQGLAEALRQHDMPVYAIGDCTGLGLIAKATSDAADALQQINLRAQRPS